jgi:hypothetical protein
MVTKSEILKFRLNFIFCCQFGAASPFFARIVSISLIQPQIRGRMDEIHMKKTLSLLNFEIYHRSLSESTKWYISAEGSQVTPPAELNISQQYYPFSKVLVLSARLDLILEAPSQLQYSASQLFYYALPLLLL